MPEAAPARAEIRVDVTLRGRLGEARRTMRVDTFATHTWVSRAIAERLGARILRPIKAETPSGAMIDRTLGELEVEIAGQTATVPVVFGESDDLEAVGRTTLAVFLLEPDLASSSVSPQPWTHVTHPPLDLEKLDRAVTAKMKESKGRVKPKPFWITVALRSTFGGKILRFDRDHFDVDLIEGEVRVLFNGSAPLIPGGHVLVTNDGAVRDVRVVKFFWDLAAACDRLLTESKKEIVSLDAGQSLHLEFERYGSDAEVRLRRGGPIVERVVAASRLPVKDLAEDVALICMMLPTMLADRNPEIRGNAVYLRFTKSVQDLWDKTHRP